MLLLNAGDTKRGELKVMAAILLIWLYLIASEIREEEDMLIPHEPMGGTK